MSHNPLAAKDFSRSQLSKLSKRGIILVRAMAMPDPDSAMPFANPLTGYMVSDGGTGRVWTWRQVVEAAR
jgi:hypothetical protein